MIFKNKMLIITLVMLIGSISCFVSEEDSVLEGKCPRDIPSFHTRTGQKLDLAKVSGAWKNIYDAHHGEESEGYKCFSFKLQPGRVPGNDTVIDLLFGI